MDSAQRRFRRRRSMTGAAEHTWDLVIALAAVVTTCLALVGCASQAKSSGPLAASKPLPGQCAMKAAPGVPAERWPAEHRQLAPPGASAIRLCRYSGLNVHPRLALSGSRLLVSAAVVGKLVSEFDRLPALAGTFACPEDDLSQIVALVAYPDGHRVTISVGLTGCELVTNGSVHRTAAGLGSPASVGPPLVNQLTELVSERSPSAGSATALEHGHWSVLARSPLGTRYAPIVVWDGHELLEFGGTAGRDSTHELIETRSIGLTGYQANDWLRHERDIDIELVDHRRIMPLVSFAHSDENIERFVRALRDLVDVHHGADGSDVGGRRVRRGRLRPHASEAESGGGVASAAGARWTRPPAPGDAGFIARRVKWCLGAAPAASAAATMTVRWHAGR